MVFCLTLGQSVKLSHLCASFDLLKISAAILAGATLRIWPIKHVCVFQNLGVVLKSEQQSHAGKLTVTAQYLKSSSSYGRSRLNDQWHLAQNVAEMPFNLVGRVSNETVFRHEWGFSSEEIKCIFWLLQNTGNHFPVANCLPALTLIYAMFLHRCLDIFLKCEFNVQNVVLYKKSMPSKHCRV